MPDPIPTNRNVRQGQQFQNTPVPPVPGPQPVRPRPAPPRYTPVPASAPSPPRFQPAPARPVAARRHMPTSLRRNPWDHKVAALVIGTGLYVAVDYYIESLFAQSTNLVNHLWGSVPLGGYTYTLTTGNILIALLFAIPLFFGAAFGPWVGLLVGAIGSLAGDYIAAQTFGFAFDWHWSVGMSLVGFFASIAQYRTRQRYTFLATTFIATIVGALAITIGIGAAALSINWSLSTAFAISLFVNFAPEALVTIIFFSFLLSVYNAILSRR